jgi:two-component system NtrC family response regulator
LITGETGTGKELVAKAIHYNSAQANKPFIAVSCSAIPKELVASELFGHKKGAFTGASSDYKGKFLLAHQGSIFLDEIATIPYDVQDKLLRILQERKITPLGDETEFAVDVRMIAATNSDLESMIKAGTFREDLYYRLNVFPIHIPPLRERIDDLPLLIKHFIKKYCKFEPRPSITPKAYQILTSYHWPGNVRELENVIERALILSDGRDIYPDHIPERLRHFSLSRKSESFPVEVELPDSGIVLDELEKGLILKALQKTEGNQTKAAALLGISRHALIYRMEKHGIAEDK